MIYKCIIKPIFDFVSAVLLLLFLSPLLLAIVTILTIVNKGSPFFFQIRAGYRGKPFKIIKFKTMNSNRGPDGELLPDKDRLTKVGTFLRKTSIDELPQLINILKGNLSLIGPRPLLMQYLPHYNERQARRHDVKPGISGWAQVHGRQSLSFEERFELDVWYVDNISLKTDIVIITMTIGNVLKSKGVIENEGFWRL